MNQAKLAVVTGGTKGIGRAVIEAFSGSGFDIVTCARNSDDLSALKRDIETKHNNRVYVCPADMSRKDDTGRFVNLVLDLNRPIDVLVNNSGVFIPGAVHTEEEGLLEQHIETNLYSAYRASRGLIPEMKKAGRGHIFNICSIASLMAYSNGGSYTISKFAMYGMSKVLREEMKPFNIRVTSVMPGATLTASWEGVDLPEERFIPPEDIAQLLLTTYQLSERSVVEDLVIRPMLGDI
ncbi:SDR family oxidoreductase [Pseudomaricurvus alcaniphilus]|uniref:SDR family oxidoreductase n=1 Tax=Pseudomaricurvus alcaniphilus TaxID=1166482 RepID=UPI001A9E4C78|nr:SDR family oxidoreductase [Pseudomaricurvus alcaniphilus]